MKILFILGGIILALLYLWFVIWLYNRNIKGYEEDRRKNSGKNIIP